MVLRSIAMVILQVVRKMLGLGILVFLVLLAGTANAQIPMSKYLTSYNQNFDALPASGTAVWESGTSTLIPGWTVQRTKPINTITANNGSGNTGGLLSYGALNSTERALGAISSSTAGEFAWGVLLQNKTGTIITSVDINFWGEQWRVSNRTAGEHKTTFWYAISSDSTTFNLSPTSDKGWTEVPELAFKSPLFLTEGKALNGNAAANKQQLSRNLALEIPDGHYVMLRWKDADELEADHALAIDDFTISWNTAYEPVVMPVELVYFRANQMKDAVQLTWETACEDQNDYFVVERSINGASFQSIGKLDGKGTGKSNQIYTLTDNKPTAGTTYYRLKQVDEDDSFIYSSVVQVYFERNLKEMLVYPTVASGHVNIAFGQPQKSNQLTIHDRTGRTVLQQQSKSGELNYTLDIASLKAGTYLLVILDSEGKKQVRRFMKQ